MLDGGLRGLLVVLAAAPMAGCSLLLDFDAQGESTDAATSDATALACTALEPNESIAGAIELEVGVSSAALCTADRDFYTFTVEAGDDIAVELRFDNPAQARALDLSLLDQEGTPITVSTGTGATERIEHTSALGNALEPGLYAVQVVAEGGFAADYELELTVTPAANNASMP